MSKKVDVVFTATLEKVAQKGEQKLVSGGFWRHYLLPRGLAIPASDKRAKLLLADRTRAEQQRATPKPVGEVVKEIREEKRAARQDRKQGEKEKDIRKAARLKANVATRNLKSRKGKE